MLFYNNGKTLTNKIIIFFSLIYILGNYIQVFQTFVEPTYYSNTECYFIM